MILKFQMLVQFTKIVLHPLFIFLNTLILLCLLCNWRLIGKQINTIPAYVHRAHKFGVIFRNIAVSHDGYDYLLSKTGIRDEFDSWIYFN